MLFIDMLHHTNDSKVVNKEEKHYSKNISIFNFDRMVRGASRKSCNDQGALSGVVRKAKK